MSNLPQQDTLEQYVGDGTTDTYLYTFLVPTSSDMAVYVTPIGQDPNQSTDLVNPSNYTVTGTGDVNGGTVVFDSAYIPALGDTITLTRDMEFSLDAEFSNAQNFDGDALDDTLERLELQAQQLNTFQQERSLSYIINSFTPPGTEDCQIPLLDDGQGWKKQGTRIIGYDIAEVPSASMLRSDLASQAQGADGADLVGYYSATSSTGMTVHDALDAMEPIIDNLGTMSTQNASAVAITGGNISGTDLNTQVNTIQDRQTVINFWQASNSSAITSNVILGGSGASIATPAAGTGTLLVSLSTITPTLTTSYLRLKVYIPIIAGTAGDPAVMIIYNMTDSAFIGGAFQDIDSVANAFYGPLTWEGIIPSFSGTKEFSVYIGVNSAGTATIGTQWNSVRPTIFTIEEIISN